MNNKKYFVLNKEKIQNEYKLDITEISPFDIGVPLIDISNNTILETYYYRWHTYCSHIKKTPEGYVITEFLPDVPWAGKYNAISCPAGHQLYEGRWLFDQKYLNSFIDY